MQKNTSVGWSSRCKFFWNELDPTLVFFPKNYKYGIKAPIKSHTCIFFFEMKISKKITSVGSSAFQKKLQQLDQPTLVFFCIFEKNYNDWIKSFSKSKWTGLLPMWVQNMKPFTKLGGSELRTLQFSKSRVSTAKRQGSCSLVPLANGSFFV